MQTSRTRLVSIALVSAALGCLLTSQVAHAQNFATLYSFQGGGDGTYPSPATLQRDKQGNLYGVTEYGGSVSCYHGFGCGTVYGLTSSGQETILHAFSRSKGFIPNFGLIRDKKGNLFGTTLAGGGGRGCGPHGCGLIYEITSHGKEKILYEFQGRDDGAQPSSDLAEDAAGNFYGTTGIGGGTVCKLSGEKVKGCGTIYKLTPDGAETVLYRFQGGSDGQFPYGNVILDAAGNLYGTTNFGGGGSCDDNSGCGTVYKLAPEGTETIIHAFTGPDGALPAGGVILDSSGTLYGTTGQGGQNCGSAGCGTVFRIATDGTESVLYSFCSQTNCADGSYPPSQLVMDKSGNLYGTTFGGNTTCSSGCGLVFKLTPDGSETVLHAFNYADGAYPLAGLSIDKNETLYGTTQAGGTNNKGTVFDITK